MSPYLLQVSNGNSRRRESFLGSTRHSAYLFSVFLKECHWVRPVRHGITNVGYPVKNGWWLGLAAEQQLTACIEEHERDQPNQAVHGKGSHGGQMCSKMVAQTTVWPILLSDTSERVAIGSVVCTAGKCWIEGGKGETRNEPGGPRTQLRNIKLVSRRRKETCGPPPLALVGSHAAWGARQAGQRDPHCHLPAS